MEYLNIIGNVIISFIYGASLGLVIKLYKSSRLHKPINKKAHLMISLYPRKVYTREDIIRIGIEALKCPITKRLLIDPVVSIDGISYEKIAAKQAIKDTGCYPCSIVSCTNENDLYENRSLKNYIENYIK